MSRVTRGQSMVETALCLLVFVTLLLAGIQFAEIGYLSLKVTEAGNFAVWQATTRRAHKLGEPGANYLDDIIDAAQPSSAAGRAQDRYADFDAFRDSGASTITQVLVKGTALSVSCGRAPTLFFRVQDQGGAGDRFRPASMLAPVVDLQGGGLRCTASAALSSRMPRKFAQQEGGKGFFSELNDKMPDLLTVCAIGRPNGGACTGHFPVLLGDWGLIGEDEADGIPHFEGSGYSGPNPTYGETIFEVWQVSGAGTGAEAQAMASAIAGSSPYSMSTFNISALKQGEPQARPSHGGTPGSFLTHGADPAHGSRVANCFLGLPGC